LCDVDLVTDLVALQGKTDVVEVQTSSEVAKFIGVTELLDEVEDVEVAGLRRFGRGFGILTQLLVQAILGLQACLSAVHVVAENVRDWKRFQLRSLVRLLALGEVEIRILLHVSILLDHAC
jgi:hypothetical protein